MVQRFECAVTIGVARRPELRTLKSRRHLSSLSMRGHGYRSNSEMKVLAVNGSPRRNRGNTEKVLSAILEEVNSLGATTETMYLADEDPKCCEHCGHPCFEDGRCAREEGATARSERIGSVDALILGAPVYCWQPNGLTCALFDKFRFPRGTWIDTSTPSISAMGVAVAGGSGTGVFAALQSIYAWFCAWRFAPLNPVPVTRYNIHQVVEDAGSLADSIVRGEKPVFSEKWDHMLLYDRLPFMSYGRIDEYSWLARSMAEHMADAGLDAGALEEIKILLNKEKIAQGQNDPEGRARNSLAAFERAYPLCR